jgi:hypothetical protein
LGKFGHFSPFVTVVRFEPSSHRITGEAFYFFAAEAQEISAKKRFGRALTQIFHQNLGKFGHFCLFVTMARFEASNIRITGQAFYLCDTVAQEISIEKRFGACLNTIISPKFGDIWLF